MRHDRSLNVFALVAAISLGASVDSLQAVSTADFIGVWKGARTEFFMGMKTKGTQTERIRKRGANGLKSRQKIELPTGTILAKSTFRSRRGKASGPYRMKMFMGGDVVSSAVGTWKLRGRKITCKFTNTNMIGSLLGTTKYSLRGKNKVKYLSKLTADVKSVATLRKKR